MLKMFYRIRPWTSKTAVPNAINRNEQTNKTVRPILVGLNAEKIEWEKMS